MYDIITLGYNSTIVHGLITTVPEANYTTTCCLLLHIRLPSLCTRYQNIAYLKRVYSRRSYQNQRKLCQNQNTLCQSPLCQSGLFDRWVYACRVERHTYRRTLRKCTHTSPTSLRNLRSGARGNVFTIYSCRFTWIEYITPRSYMFTHLSSSTTSLYASTWFLPWIIFASARAAPSMVDPNNKILLKFWISSIPELVKSSSPIESLAETRRHFDRIVRWRAGRFSGNLNRSLTSDSLPIVTLKVSSAFVYSSKAFSMLLALAACILGYRAKVFKQRSKSPKRERINNRRSCCQESEVE